MKKILTLKVFNTNLNFNFIWILVSAWEILCKDHTRFFHGYTRKNGTYVKPYYRSSSDGILSNNWSNIGNVNPYTGKKSTQMPGVNKRMNRNNRHNSSK